MVKHGKDKAVFSAIKFIQTKLYLYICEREEEEAMPHRSNRYYRNFLHALRYLHWHSNFHSLVQNISAFWQNGWEMHSKFLFKISFLTLHKSCLSFYCVKSWFSELLRREPLSLSTAFHQFVWISLPIGFHLSCYCCY